MRFVPFNFLSRWLSSLPIVKCLMCLRPLSSMRFVPFPGPMSCRCLSSSFETPPRWHTTISFLILIIQDGADTAKKFVGVLDPERKVKKVRASGICIHTDFIYDIGQIRLRYPIAPLSIDGHQAFKVR